MLNKKFMGLIILAPGDKQPDGATELWINIGWNAKTKGAQKVPDWIPALEPVVSKEAYDRLMERIVSHIQANGINPWLGMCAMMTMGCGIGCLVMIGLKIKVDSLNNQLRDIVSEAGLGGASPPELKMTQMATPQGNTPSAMGFDQYGSPVMGNFGGGEHRASYSAPTWPPLGYNIIVRVPGTTLRDQWPKTTAVGGAMADPSQIGASAPVVAAVPIDAPQAEVMARGEDPKEKMRKLKEMQDEGLISAEEFEQKKKELLDRM